MFQAFYERLYRNQYWRGYMAQLISLVALLIFNIVLPRVIGIERFAMISLGYSIVYFGILLLDEGFNVEVIVNKERRWNAIIKLKMICCIIVFCLLSLALHRIFLIFNINMSYLLPLHVFALNMVFVPFVSAVSSYFVAFNKNEMVITINTISGVMVTIVPLFFAFLTNSTFLIVNSVTISYLIVSLVCGVLFFKNKVGPQISGLSTGLLLKSIDQSASSLTNVFFSWGIFVLLTKYYGTDIAVYNKIAFSMCAAICSLLPIVNLNLYQTYDPEDRNSMLYYKRLFVVVVLVSLAASLILYSVGAYVVAHLLGAHFSAAVFYIRSLSFVVILKAVTDILRPVILRKYGHVYLLGAGVASILSVLALMWFRSQLHFLRVYHLYYSAYVILLCLYMAPILLSRIRNLWYRLA